jgi:hypothetical protein
MLYCNIDDLDKYVLKQFLEAVESNNPGSIEEHIVNVSGELSEAIEQGGYDSKNQGSFILKSICSVIVCFRSIGAITTVMSDGDLSDNKWLPLQTLYKKAIDQVEQIRAGNLNPFPDNSGSSILFKSSEKIFTDDLLRFF